MTLRFLPTPAAVRRYLHLGDHARAGPRQAGNLDISSAGHVQSRRRSCNHGFRTKLKMVPARLAAKVGPRDRMIHAFIPGHVRLVHDLDMYKIIHAGGGFPAWDDE